MMHELKPYRAYRDAGVPWLDRVPAHWEVWRNGRLFAKAGDTGFPELPILEVSLKTSVRVRDFEGSTRKQVMAEREKYQRARRGDLAYNMMRMWQGAVGVAPVDGLVSPAYVVARPLPGVESRYYEYLFRTAAYTGEVNQYSRGIVSDRNRLYWEQFKQMPSLVPPPDEAGRDRPLPRLRRSEDPALHPRQAEADPAAGGAEAGGRSPRRHARARPGRAPEAVGVEVAGGGAGALGGTAIEGGYHAH
jgi:hypothetical protein